MEMTTPARGHRNSAAAHLGLAVLPVAAAAALGSWATIPNIPTWYAALAKPPFTPPNGLFGPAWTVLYILMAFAVWRVLRARPMQPGRGRAIALFFVQLGLNAAWPWTFFAARSPGAGLVHILALDVVVLWTTVLFWRVDRSAALALLPYFLWILFATYLNTGVWRLNG